MTQQAEQSAIERADWRTRRVRALLAGMEGSLGEDRIGSSPLLDSTLRNLLDLAREETAVLCQILEGGGQ